MLEKVILPLQQQARATGHRRALVISGERDWIRRQLAAVDDVSDWCWVGNEPLDGVARVVAMNKATSLLGQDTRVVVFDCFSGLHPDGLGAVSGSVRGGGLLILLTPPLALWPDFADPDYLRYLARPELLGQQGNGFLQRTLAILQADPCVTLVAEGQPWPTLLSPSPSPSSSPELTEIPAREPVDNSLCVTSDQANAVAAVIKTITGHRRRPLVLSADRGRGKSSALGIAAGQLLLQQLRRILITAPSPQAVSAVFEQASRVLAAGDGQLDRKGHCLTWRSPEGAEKQLLYVSPDELLRSQPDAEMLLVDEAAAIPTPMLEVMLARYSRLVYATTLHGYEGTGRGFALRFQAILSQRTPNWRRLHLKQAIRWRDHDPVEALVFRLLALDAEATAIPADKFISPQDCQIRCLSQAELLARPDWLEQLFGLLILAHYRTTPSDFRQLLDAPQLQIFVMLNDDKVIATALLSLEGELETELAGQIWAGKRRLRGHLLPQSLIAQSGFIEAAGLRYGRIMRIAVHPQLHRQGLGQHLHQYIEHWSATQSLDFLGASFGATVSLLEYWRAVNCRLVRLGITRDAASGSHGALVLNPLSEAGTAVFKQVQQRFQQQLPGALMRELRELSPEMVQTLVPSWEDELPLATQDQRDVAAFAWGRRPLELALPALQQCVWQQPWRLQRLTASQPALLALVVKKILQCQEWQDVIASTELAGRKQAEALLRDAFTILVPEFHQDFVDLLT